MDENLNPFDKSRKPWRKVQAAAPRRKNKSPAWGRGFRKRHSGGCHLAGAVDASVADFLLFEDLLCFLL